MLNWKYFNLKAVRLPTIYKLKTGRFDSNRRKDQHEDFWEEQSICQYQENMEQNMISRLAIKRFTKCLTQPCFFLV